MTARYVNILQTG